MKIGGLVKNSFVDYPEKITCVIFTIGCNMNCWYCHNKILLNSETEFLNEQEIFTFLESHKSFLDAVTISGGEPTLQKDLPTFIRKVKKMGYLVKLDTNGTNYDMLKDLIDNNLLDYVAMDIKAPLDKYNLVTETANIEEVKKCIGLLKQNKVGYEFRTTLSPNLSLEDIENIAKELIGAKYYTLQQYRVPEHILNNFRYKMNECFLPYFKLKPIEQDKLYLFKDIASKYIRTVIIKND